jgi:CBS domain-containing protein
MSTALGSIAVSQVMSTPVKTTNEYDTTENACKMMVQNNIGSIVVTAQSHSNQPTGIITGRDIVRHLAERKISFATLVSQIMSKPIVTMRTNGTLRDALQEMQARNFRRLVVVSEDGNNNMVGIVTDKDIFRFIMRNEPLPPTFVRDAALLGGNMPERFNTSLLDDLVHGQGTDRGIK